LLAVDGRFDLCVGLVSHHAEVVVGFDCGAI
jgi:hypothetical protein